MKKMDEMDRNIRMRSESWGYRVAILFLWIWLMYSLYKSKVYGARIEIFPWMILSISSFVQLVSETVINFKGNEDGNAALLDSLLSRKCAIFFRDLDETKNGCR